MKSHKTVAPKTMGRPSVVRMVPINEMRTPPALVTQRRFRKAHGDRIAAELDLNKLGLPIVNHRDGIYWLVDGQHRIYGLRQNGFKDELLECQVYENLTDAEMADTFLGADDRKAVPLFDKFHIACTAGHVRERDIQRTVETQGLKISQGGTDENSIGAIAALGKVYDRAGTTVLGQVLRTLRDAYGGDPKGFDGTIIEGVGLVFNRYGSRLTEHDLTKALTTASTGARGLLRRAEAQRQRTGNQKAHCVAATVVDIYNRGVDRGKRAPAWWKESVPEVVVVTRATRKVNGTPTKTSASSNVRLPQKFTNGSGTHAS